MGLLDVFNTPPTLPPREEEKYRSWMTSIGQTKDNGMAVDDNFTGKDYDYRGFYKKYGAVDKASGEHFTDEFKLPNHESFSEESRYATPFNPGGRWSGEAFQPANMKKRGYSAIYDTGEYSVLSDSRSMLDKMKASLTKGTPEHAQFQKNLIGIADDAGSGGLGVVPFNRAGRLIDKIGPALETHFANAKSTWAERGKWLKFAEVQGIRTQKVHGLDAKDVEALKQMSPAEGALKVGGYDKYREIMVDVGLQDAAMSTAKKMAQDFDRARTSIFDLEKRAGDLGYKFDRKTGKVSKVGQE